MKSNNISPIAENIKKYRTKLGISQDRLSKLADVTYNTIIKLESGVNTNPTIETLSKIANAFDVGIDDLVRRNSRKAQNSEKF